MNTYSLRTVPRRDRVVVSASVVMLLASVLPLTAMSLPYASGTTWTPWHVAYAPTLVLGYLLGVGVGVVVVLDRLTGVRIPERLFGLERPQLLAVAACWSAAQLLLTLVANDQRGSGLWLAVLAAATLVAGTVFADRIPFLRDPVAQEASAQTGDAAPYWFNVAAPVDVYDATDGSVRYTLTPGEWYLATVSYGTAIGVRDEAHGDAVLHDHTVVRRA